MSTFDLSSCRSKSPTVVISVGILSALSPCVCHCSANIIAKLSKVIGYELSQLAEREGNCNSTYNSHT